MAAPDIAGGAVVGSSSALAVNPELYSPTTHLLLDGDLVDAIGARNLSVIAGTVGYGAGIGGRRCAVFNGSTYAAYTGDNTVYQVGDQTVAFWFRNLTAANMCMFAIDSATFTVAADNMALVITRLANGSPPYQLQMYSASGAYSLTPRLSDLSAFENDWHHVIVSRSSGVYSGYLDGEPMWATPPSAVTVTPGANAQFTLGALRRGANYHHGALQSVMWWDSALSDAQQQAIVRAVGLAVGA